MLRVADDMEDDNVSENDFFLGDLDGAGDSDHDLPDNAVQSPSGGGAGILFDAPPPPADVAALFPNSGDVSKLSVVNSICFMTLGRPIDLRVLACSARNVEFDPRRHAAVMRLREPPCAALVRISGVVTISGAASVAAARRAAMLIARIVRAVFGWREELKSVKFAVKSLMFRFDLKHPVRLEEMARARPDIVSYEPEAFCGAVVKLRGIADNRQWSAACSVYVSGKVTMAGPKSQQEAQYAYDAVLPIIARYARGAKPAQQQQQ